MSRPGTPHAAHDELLIARLFGADVDDRERTLAQEQVAGCEDCAALYADLASIARATAALPVPTRPRDFTLTVADAARLQPGRRGWARFVGLGRRRSFGGALVALGFSGLLLTGALSILGPRASSESRLAMSPDERAAAQDLGTNANFQPAATPAPAVTAAPAYAVPSPAPGDGGAKGVIESPVPLTVPTPALAPATPAPAPATPAPAPATPAQAPATPAPAPASPGAMGQLAASPSAGEAGSGGVAPAQGQPAPPDHTTSTATSQSGPDVLQLIALGASTALALGALILLGPALRRRSRGRSHR
jgi:hypothetical protein